MKKILLSDEVNADELCIFVALVRWGIRQVTMRPIEFEQVGLEQVLSNLIKHVRWTLMSPVQIVDVVRPIGIAPVDDLFEALAAYHSAEAPPPTDMGARKGSSLKSADTLVDLMQRELHRLRRQQDYFSPSKSKKSMSGEVSPLFPPLLSPPHTATLNVAKSSKELHDITDEGEKKAEGKYMSPEGSNRKKRKNETRFRKEKSAGKIRHKPSDKSHYKTTPSALSPSNWTGNRKRSDSAEAKLAEAFTRGEKLGGMSEDILPISDNIIHLPEPDVSTTVPSISSPPPSLKDIPPSFKISKSSKHRYLKSQMNPTPTSGSLSPESIQFERTTLSPPHQSVRRPRVEGTQSPLDVGAPRDTLPTFLFLSHQHPSLRPCIGGSQRQEKHEFHAQLLPLLLLLPSPSLVREATLFPAVQPPPHVHVQQ